MKYLSLFSGIGGFELGIQQAWIAKNVTKRESSTKEDIYAKNVSDNINLTGELKTLNTVGKLEESIMHCDESEFLKCTEENVPVVGRLSQNSSRLNTEMEMDTSTERNMEQGTCINLQSKKTIQKNTKSSVTTATMQEEDMEYAPTCIGFSEIDKYAQQIYLKHFPNHKPLHDITKIEADKLPDFDFLCGGFPCQSFSIAGKRLGFTDTRGTLFFDIARILKVKNPRLVLLENVKGLLSHDNGNTFKTIISTLDELGYDLQWQVLNSKNFGVPQNRERVFIVGHLRETSRPEVFPIGESNGSDITQLNQPRHSNSRVYGESGISPTLNTMQGGNRQPKIGIDTAGLQTIATSIDANYHKGNGHRGTSRGRTLALHDMKIRRLTPTECERLQGFPDGWTEGISDTQRYKCLGNAVTVNVIKEIVSRLI